MVINDRSASVHLGGKYNRIGNAMVENPDGMCSGGEVERDVVIQLTDDRIRREALRQILSVDIEDDHARMERVGAQPVGHFH